jgi:hypothetical protein
LALLPPGKGRGGEGVSGGDGERQFKNGATLSQSVEDCQDKPAEASAAAAAAGFVFADCGFSAGNKIVIDIFEKLLHDVVS